MRAIDADALMKELEREVELADDWKTAHEIVNVVKYFPTIEPKQKKGRWIYSAGTSGSDTTTALKFFPTCSECGTEHFTTNFCPNCGADMREDKE